MSDKCCGSDCGDDSTKKSGLGRRGFMKVAGAGTAVVTGLGGAGHFGKAEAAFAEGYAVPSDKGLDSGWVKSLRERGERKVYKGWDEVKYIGMPVGGIGSGTVYLGGDGKLWCWDIFNVRHEGCVPNVVKDLGEVVEGEAKQRVRERDGSNYVKPLEQWSPWNIDQGFAVTVDGVRRTLDHEGFEDVSFKGEYPIGNVNYKGLGVAIELEAYSPFAPLNAGKSSYPATVMRYAVKNTGRKTIEVSVEGWMENPGLRGHKGKDDAERTMRGIEQDEYVGVVSEIDTYNLDLRNRGDFGSVALVCLDDAAEVMTERKQAGRFTVSDDVARAKVGELIVGGVRKTATVKAGETIEFVFVVAWHFANAKLPGVKSEDSKRWYASEFENAEGVAKAVAGDLEELTHVTRLWRDTWYGGSLPHWLLDRSLVTMDALQTNTFYRFESGQVWAWEGVGCCPGTCTHVWHYAQSVGRLFPELEQDLRVRTDYGKGFNKFSGKIDFRGGLAGRDATDGQAGVVLRTYREHLVSGDGEFLRGVWDRTKLAVEFLIMQDMRDGEPDGIPVGEQHNTLDAEWFGKVPVLASLYLAALAAGAKMGEAMGDDVFSKRCNTILDRGRKNILSLFKEDFGYFVQHEDPKHMNAIGTGKGCYIDQVMGQWWAGQLGMGRLYDGGKIRSALHKLWEFNFCPDMGALRGGIKQIGIKGRPYAVGDEMGLLMCTWPKGGKRDDWEKFWQFGYFNECMSGFEYEVAGHMVWESKWDETLLDKGLAIVRSLDDRYDGKKRNPYNEIECSDHYARAMSSYGVFLAASGFEYDGVEGKIGFGPRLGAEDFECAFTGAAGWGCFSQQIRNGIQEGRLNVKWGEVSVKEFGLQVAESVDRKRMHVEVIYADGKRADAVKISGKHMTDDGMLWVKLTDEVTVGQDTKLSIVFSS